MIVKQSTNKNILLESIPTLTINTVEIINVEVIKNIKEQTPEAIDASAFEKYIK